MSFTPSKFQQAIFDFIQNETGSAIIEAVAGSGKTTTIVKGLALIPTNLRVTFLAFNKKIATELQSRVPQHVKAATFHAQGFAAWRNVNEGCQVDGSKLNTILRNNFAPVDADQYGQICRQLVSLAKSVGMGALVPNEDATWYDLAEHHSIELPEMPAQRARQIELARVMLEISIEMARKDRGVIDFDDMLFMPLIDNVPFFKSDVILVDEAQDTNSVQLAILRRMLKPGGRLIAVGDKAQAIYGFRGADSTAMDNIAKAFSCVTLKLSKCYRCAKRIVALAQSIVPHIEAADNAPDGEIFRDVKVAEANFAAQDVVICRNTAPLIELAYQLIAQRKGCKVLGREIGAGLVQLIQKMNARGIDTLMVKLDAYMEREMAKFLSKGQEDRAEGVKDRVECIQAIIAHLVETKRTVSGLIDEVSAMFSDDTSKSVLTLCTAHKSKGLEWDRVFILRSDLMPSKWARQAWQQEQERNLQYVAWTRARLVLTFLLVEKKDGAAPTVKVPEVKFSNEFVSPTETNRERAVRRAAFFKSALHPFWIE